MAKALGVSFSTLQSTRLIPNAVERPLAVGSKMMRYTRTKTQNNTNKCAECDRTLERLLCVCEGLSRVGIE